MHERSLVARLIEQVEAIRKQHRSEQVRAVHVEVGPLSGVEPDQFLAAFEDLASSAGWRGTRLQLDQIPLEAKCKECGEEFTVQAFCFHCPTCKGNVAITRGDSVRLMSVSLDEAGSTAGEVV